MCLNRVTWEGKPRAGVRKAWKVLVETDIDSGVRLPHRSMWMPITFNRWVLADVRPIGTWKTKYNSGFHVLATAAGARKYVKRNLSSLSTVIVRVEIKGLHTKGEQSGIPTWVCERMRVTRKAVEAARKAAKRG